MAFDMETLITDRTAADVASGTDKGYYNATDLNRVDACLEDLVARLGRMGYNVPGYQRVKLPRETKPGSRLPDGYTEVQYIQSTGTQYVDTGFKPNQNSRVICDYQFTSTTEEQTIFMARTSSSANMFGVFHNTEGWNYCYGAKRIPGASGISITDRIKLDCNKEKASFNGTALSNDAATFKAPVNMTLFARNTNGTLNNYASAKLYSCQIYDNGTLIRDYVSCISPVGAVGLYDLVDGKFYGNSGTGAFFAGPRRVTLPEGYTQVEHIQSSGAQYINSKLLAGNNTRVVLDAQLSTTPTANTSLFGARTVASSKNYAMLFIPSTFRSDYNAAYTQTWTADATVRRIYDKNKETTTIDGLSKSYVNAAFQCDYELFLFAMNQAGGAQWFASGKIFACQIYSNNNLSRDYIPCTNANGAAGLYDLVSQEFYGNAGTGSFTAGEAVTWPEDPEEPAEELDPYTWYESDVPTVSQMAQYRGNVAAVRSVLQLPDGTPEPPGSMAQLTTAGANSIEAVLLAVDLILRNISAAVRHCGVAVCGSKGVIA